MASLALGVVGTAIGGPLGGFIGAQIGSVIDNQLFASDMEGPRLDDLSVSASTYGSPIPLLYGPQNRVSGNIIWSTGLIETKEKEGGKGGPSVTTYSYRVSLAMALGEGPLNGIKRIWGNSKLIYDAGASGDTHAVFDTLAFYSGDGTQDPDPTIESYLGVGNTPAYRHTAYIVLKDLQLADFGNRIPNIEVEVEAHPSITVAGVIKDISDRAGVDKIYASSLARDEVKGYVVGRATTAAAALRPLSLVYNFDAVEHWGQVRCVKRGGQMRATIETGDLGAVQGGNDPAEPIRFEREPDMAMPQEAAISFSDPDLDYQKNTQRARRLLGSSENNLSHEAPVTITADEARQFADRVLWEAWAARRSAKFALSDKYVHLWPADVVGVFVDGQVVPFKINRATRGANAVIDVDGLFEDAEIYNSPAPGTAGILPDNPLRLPGPTTLVMMDAPILQSADDDAGFYWAATGELPGWRGAEVLRSTDGGTTYDVMSPVRVRSVIGDVAAALPAGPAEFWDRANTLTVDLVFEDDQLESIDELNVLAGANAAWLGSPDGQDGEIIQFATATLVAPGTYELSDLLRGRLGTEHAIDSHGPDEVFVLLESGLLGRSDFSAADWDKQRHYKPVSILKTEADTTAQTFTNTGEGKRPLSPVHVRGERDGSDNLTVTWVRRSRIRAPGLGYGPLPLGEQSESYEVDVIVGGSPVRTIAVTDTEATYSAADQTADGITPGDPVTVKVYQLSASRGRGRPANAIL